MDNKTKSKSLTFDELIKAGVPLDPNLIVRASTKRDKLKREMNSIEIILDNEVLGNFGDFQTDVDDLIKKYSEFFKDGELEELQKACDVVDEAFCKIKERFIKE